jgi:hypothetical protein
MLQSRFWHLIADIKQERAKNDSILGNAAARRQTRNPCNVAAQKARLTTARHKTARFDEFTKYHETTL